MAEGKSSGERYWERRGVVLKEKWGVKVHVVRPLYDRPLAWSPCKREGQRGGMERIYVSAN